MPLICYVKGHNRRYIHTFGANAFFEASDIPPDRVARCKVLYLGGYLVMDRVKPGELSGVFAAARRAGRSEERRARERVEISVVAGSLKKKKREVGGRT